jgi:MYND finger
MSLIKGEDLGEKRTKAFMQCSKCRSVRYCSRECQVLHWKKGHKKECSLLASKQTQRKEEAESDNDDDWVTKVQS